MEKRVSVVLVWPAVSPVSSNLPLQQLLHYHIMYSAVYAFLMTGVLVHKLTVLEYGRIMTFVVPSLLALWFLIECGRLWIGFWGNMRERVPELSAFLLLTVFPQTVLVGYLSFGAFDRLPIELLIGIPHVVLLVLEVIFALSTVRSFMAKQTAEFFRAVQVDSDRPRTSEFPGGGSSDWGVPTADEREWLATARAAASHQRQGVPRSPYPARPGLWDIGAQGIRGLRGFSGSRDKDAAAKQD